ncbi:MAG: hypothetical protein JRN20_10535 [Nitrososphaerota archaeon]|nr:hypothetical protein [Nitrososphaerota archaeon]
MAYSNESISTVSIYHFNLSRIQADSRISQKVSGAVKLLFALLWFYSNVFGQDPAVPNLVEELLGCAFFAAGLDIDY